MLLEQLARYTPDNPATTPRGENNTNEKKQIGTLFVHNSTIQRQSSQT